MLEKSIPLLSAMAVIMMALLPLNATATEGMAVGNEFWWPEKLSLEQLRVHDPASNPYGKNFNYAEAFSKVDVQALKADIEKVLTTSKDWWPADWAHYGGLMIRMAWHAAGTYRTLDGRGGAEGAQQRFEPLNSWPDNVSLDKARRLLEPVKQKYGRSVSWGDLMILAGNVALESMGFETLGFAGGRIDDWEADHVYWGAETKWLSADKRFKDKKLESPLAAVQMGLIYVNPEGPGGNMDPKAAAEHMRLSFGRMAMNDEEIVALVAGGHTLGKAHGGRSAADCVGAEPAAAPVEAQGFGWNNKCGRGIAEDAVTSGLEGAWTQTPTAWSILYLNNLFTFDWKQQKSPGGGTVWVPTDEAAHGTIPDAHVKGKRNPPIMFTTDLALKEDPGFRKIAERFWKNPKAFDTAFAKAWFKLTHRDMGPRARYVGAEVPSDVFSWQDPIPPVDHKLISNDDAEKLEVTILKSGLTIPELVRTAWASASTYRGSDMRGGADGARVRLAPQKDWAANNPEELAKVLGALEKIQQAFNQSLSGGKKVSFADVIVIAGNAAVEEAAKKAGHNIEIPFTPGRMDASREQTDVKSFAWLEPTADAFRNYYSDGSYGSPAAMLVEKADLLTLTAPEMTVLVGGMRALNANAGQDRHGVLTNSPGTLTNDFFVNLLDMSTQWSKSDQYSGIYEGLDRASGKRKWTATSVDLIFGSNSELRALAEAYAASDSKEKFVTDFAAAWTKVMNLGRFEPVGPGANTVAER
ncbi:MAG: catalase/peroxidase HPI [Burkholderiaceae bacterium]|nr:catalase/peroxidase HPI [Burkholderiaceae bacterium]MDH3461006.1 catalase/peroxidase HPI [Burkholderiaceae bacterium]